LSPELRHRTACIADVDEKKIAHGFYCNRDISVKIPIVHFSLLARDPIVRRQLQEAFHSGDISSTDIDPSSYGRINKGKDLGNELSGSPPTKKIKLASLHAKEVDDNSIELYQKLPVLVCVAMHWTGGALEHNVSLVGRTEGKDLRHVC
jgi:hypothetical protein